MVPCLIFFPSCHSFNPYAQTVLPDNKVWRSCWTILFLRQTTNKKLPHILSWRPSVSYLMEVASQQPRYSFTHVGQHPPTRSHLSYPLGVPVKSDSLPGAKSEKGKLILWDEPICLKLYFHCPAFQGLGASHPCPESVLKENRKGLHP